MRARLTTVAVLVAGIAMLRGVDALQLHPGGIFLDAGPAGMAGDPGALRVRFVHVDLDSLEAARVRVGTGGTAPLRFNLFDDVQVTAGTGALRSGDVVTLRTQSGHYVNAEDGGGAGVRADETRPAPWTRFQLRRD